MTIAHEKIRSQRNTCFARRHMKSGPWALYDYAFKLSHGRNNPSGVFWSNARHARELGVSKTTFNEWIHLLAAQHWFECLDKEPQRRSKTTGRLMPIRYSVRDHDEWAALHPGKCFFAEAAPKTWRKPKTNPQPVPETGTGERKRTCTHDTTACTSFYDSPVPEIDTSPVPETGTKTVEVFKTLKVFKTEPFIANVQPQTSRSNEVSQTEPNQIRKFADELSVLNEQLRIVESELTDIDAKLADAKAKQRDWLDNRRRTVIRDRATLRRAIEKYLANHPDLQQSHKPDDDFFLKGKGKTKVKLDIREQAATQILAAYGDERLDREIIFQRFEYYDSRAVGKPHSPNFYRTAFEHEYGDAADWARATQAQVSQRFAELKADLVKREKSIAEADAEIAAAAQVGDSTREKTMRFNRNSRFDTYTDIQRAIQDLLRRYPHLRDAKTG
jgi:hypothetical protein